MRVAAVLRNCVAHGIPQGVACVLKVLLCGIGGLIVQSLARVRVVERAEACRFRTQAGSNAVIRRVRPWQRTLAARAGGAPGLGVAAVVLILARRAVSAGAKAEVFASGARTSTARAVRSAVVCTSPEQLERKRRVADTCRFAHRDSTRHRLPRTNSTGHCFRRTVGCHSRCKYPRQPPTVYLRRASRTSARRPTTTWQRRR